MTLINKVFFVLLDIVKYWNKGHALSNLTPSGRFLSSSKTLLYKGEMRTKRLQFAFFNFW